MTFTPNAPSWPESRADAIGQNGNDGDHYDAVNRPAHYQGDGVECIDAIEAALGTEGAIAYCRGNALKYIWRAGKKSDAVEDLKKANWYLDRAAKLMEAN